ncbi:MAG: hypothetical protein ACI35P_15625 [Bacillus sp. (in: firmicutes)]
MRKIIFSFIMIFMAISAGAQTTFNIRAGAGVFDYKYEIKPSDYDTETFFNGTIIAQANISLGRRSYFTFSPSAMVATDLLERPHVYVPLFIGYKIPTGNQCLFFPKIGPMAGIDFKEDRFTVGPSAELAFELKHFVVSANFHLGLLDCATIGAFATVGYKF